MKALLMGYYGMGNLGDEMMLVCLRPWLEKQGFSLTVLSERPGEVTRSHGLPAVENLPLLGEWAWFKAWFKGGAWQVIRAIRESDALIVGGGDLIRDDRGWRGFFYTIEKMVLAILLKRRVYVVNAGIGEPCTSYGRVVLRWVLRRCGRIIVRDQRSERICRELGASSQTTLAPDVVLTLPEMLASLPSAGTPAKDPYVVVCLRHNANVFQMYDLNDGRLKNLAASLDEFIERHGVSVVFLPFQSNPASGRGDSELHDRVMHFMRHAERAQSLAWTGDLAEVCRWVRPARFVLAMRLHAAVLALSCERPTILMPYDRKISEFGDLMQIPHKIEASTLDDPSAVAAVFEAAWKESEGSVRYATSLDASSIWKGLSLGSVRV
jgi:polysaccharide pyruvyl transferase CsaB